MGIDDELKKRPCKNCGSATPNFIKITQILNTGVGVYHDTARSRNRTLNVEPSKTNINRSNEVAIILHNTDNVFYDSARGFKSVLEPTMITCPQCKINLENTQKLLKDIIFIDKNSVMAVCDICKNKLKKIKSCQDCASAVKRFLEVRELDKSAKSERNEGSNKVSRQVVKSAPNEHRAARDHTQQRIENLFPSASDHEFIQEKPYNIDKISISPSRQKTLYETSLKPPCCTIPFCPNAPPVSLNSCVDKDNELYFFKRCSQDLLSKRNKVETLNSISDKKDKEQPPVVKIEKNKTKKDQSSDQTKNKLKKVPPAENKNVQKKESKPEKERTVQIVHKTVRKSSKENIIIGNERNKNEADKIVKDLPKKNETKENKVKVGRDKESNITGKTIPRKSIPKIDSSLYRKKSIDESCSICDGENKSVSVHNKPEVNKDIIIKHDILHNKIPRVAGKYINEKVLLFKSVFKTLEYETISEKKPVVKIKDPQNMGNFRYCLSDPSFIEKGWTLLPMEKVMRKIYVFRLEPAQPHFDWFKNNKHKGTMTYCSGEKKADFNIAGGGRWFYKNGRVALDYYDNPEQNSGQRAIVYSSGEPDERGCTRPVTVLAIFDFLGNCVVFDHSGNIRLKYNQTEGVVLDKTLGPLSKWNWHSLNDPPTLQKIMTETIHQEDLHVPSLNTPNKLNEAEEEMLHVEHHNFLNLHKASNKHKEEFKSFEIRIKALKINNNFSLRVVNQATVNLYFHDDQKNLKVNLGMTLDQSEVLEVDNVEVDEVTVLFDLPPKTKTIADLQKIVEDTRRYERAYLERQNRIRPVIDRLSMDNIVASKSKPLPATQAPMRKLCQHNTLCISTSTSGCSRTCHTFRKPSYSSTY